MEIKKGDKLSLEVLVLGEEVVIYDVINDDIKIVQTVHGIVWLDENTPRYTLTPLLEEILSEFNIVLGVL
ncbi:MAG TPA: hypothetical protein VI911_11250 [Patescibacteria group bacterium]|nr:hypothetical protein [Patescibacteria group bacterium]